MPGRSHLHAIRLLPETYERWLKENLKEVPGGPIVLIPNLYSDNQDDVYFNAYQMNSEELPEHYVKNLIILGIYNKYKGFRIWVTVENYDYLLMAHQKHEGKFQSTDGRALNNHPHFHEIDYSAPPEKGKPATRRPVPASLYPGINSAELLNAFMEHYYIDDGSPNGAQLPSRPSVRQKGLHDF